LIHRKFKTTLTWKYSNRWPSQPAKNIGRHSKLRACRTVSVPLLEGL